MKERANGYKFKSCDEETAINVVNAQTESERQVPFSTEQACLDTARLLSQMNREIELGNEINLNLLLTLMLTRPTTTPSTRLWSPPSHMLRSSSAGMSRRHDQQVSLWQTYARC